MRGIWCGCVSFGQHLGCWYCALGSRLRLVCFVYITGRARTGQQPTSKGHLKHETRSALHLPSKPGLRGALPCASSTPVDNFRFSYVCASHSKKNQDAAKSTVQTLNSKFTSSFILRQERHLLGVQRALQACGKVIKVIVITAPKGSNVGQIWRRMRAAVPDTSPRRSNCMHRFAISS